MKSSPSFFLKSVLLGLTLSAVSVPALMARDYTRECSRMRNQSEFVLNEANAHALIALSCSALTHVENERRHMVYEDSATLLHLWNLTRSDDKIMAEGYCSVPLNNLREDSLRRHRVDLTFSEIETNSGQLAISVSGQIAGKSMDLKFTNNQFLHRRCGRYEQNFNKLNQISLGSGFGLQTLIDMLRSQRTGISLSLIGEEVWASGSNNRSVNNIALQYTAAQWNARRLGLALVGTSSQEIVVRSANALEYYEGGSFYDIDMTDSGYVYGFKDQNRSDNHRFRMTSVHNSSQMMGCSSLIYESELADPEGVNFRHCERELRESSLGNSLLRHNSVPMPSPSTSSVSAEELKIIEMQRLATRYFDQRHGRAMNYSQRPNIFESNRARWNREHRERGFVVTRRDVQVNVDREEVVVRENRYNSLGQQYTQSYRVSFRDLQ